MVHFAEGRHSQHEFRRGVGDQALGHIHEQDAARPDDGRALADQLRDQQPAERFGVRLDQ